LIVPKTRLGGFCLDFGYTTGEIGVFKDASMFRLFFYLNLLWARPVRQAAWYSPALILS
jgi:hypothetical protein